MNLDQIYGELKKQEKDNIFSEGMFKVIVDNETVLQTEVVVLNSGHILPKDWDIFEDAIYRFDGVEGSLTIFENSDGKFPCILYDENEKSPMFVIIPGVQFSRGFEDRMTELMAELITEDDFRSWGITSFDKEAWNNYVSVKDTSKKLKM